MIIIEQRKKQIIKILTELYRRKSLRNRSVLNLVYHNWKVYRWAYNQLHSQREKVEDELVTFMPVLRLLEETSPQTEGENP